LTVGTPAAFNPMDFSEVCDLTINCNLEGQSIPNVAAGAVRLMGNHVRVRRVRVINWGTLASSNPCFVVQLITAHTDAVAGRLELENVAIEDCIATSPSQFNVGSATIFHAGAKEEGTLPLQMEGYGLAPAIRNCFVDGTPIDEEVDPLLADIRALSMGWCQA